MDVLQNIFNNRELAVGFWLAVSIICPPLNKIIKDFLKAVIPILFCKKFVYFYLCFFSYFSIMILLLFEIGFWELSLLKDTIFWVILVEFPIFARIVEKSNDSQFFIKLIKENLAFIILIKFILNFWTFNFLVELIIVPISFFLGGMFALSLIEKKYEKVKKFLNRIFIISGLFVIWNTIVNILNSPEDLLKISSLKIFLLSFLLLVLNFPVVYILGLHSNYEQVFIRLKGMRSEQKKMKLTLILFSGIKLSKIAYVRNNLNQTTVISLNNNELKKNLKILQQRLNYQVGENYMKKAKNYFIGSIIGLIISIAGIIFCNLQISIKDFLSLNFVLDIKRIKEIATYIFSSGVVVFIILFFVSIGFKRRKYEEISNVKKYALYDLLFLIKKQNSAFQEFIPIEAPKELYVQYISFVYELKIICENNLEKYENLLTSWELDKLEELRTYIDNVVLNVKISSDDFFNFSIEEFYKFFTKNEKNAIKNEKINIYLDGIKKSLEKYQEQIQICMEEFKNIIS